MITIKNKLFKWDFDNDKNGLYVYITFKNMIYFLIYAGLFFAIGLIFGITICWLILT